MLGTAAIEYKAEPLSGFDVDVAEGIIAGYVARFNTRDRSGDVTLPGAFRASLADRMPKMKIPLLKQHDIGVRIGRPLELKEDQDGLWGRFKISKTRDGADEILLIKDGVVNTFSYGYSVPPGGAEILTTHPSGVRGVREGEPSRYLSEMDIKECSTVVLSIEDGARIMDLKADENGPDYGGLDTLADILHGEAWIAWLKKWGRKLSPEAEKVARDAIAALQAGEKSLTAALERAVEEREYKADAGGSGTDPAEPPWSVGLKLLTGYDPLRALGKGERP